MPRCALLESWGKAVSMGTCHAPPHLATVWATCDTVDGRHPAPVDM